MKLIPLTQGKFAKVDDEDYEWLNQFKWDLRKCKHLYYAVRRLNKEKKVLQMHRQILNTPFNMIGEHKDGDGLNNQRYNIRNCTQAQNTRNRRGNLNSTSKYKGVSKINIQISRVLKNGEIKIYSYERFLSQIIYNGKNKFLGTFKTEDDAAIAYNNAALKYHKEFARLNLISNQ